MNPKERIVVALGGNAILSKGEEGTTEQQLKNIKKTCEKLLPFFEKYSIVLTHGNGPQVGNLLLQQKTGDAPAIPLDVCGAMTQGQLGYLLQQTLRNLSKKETATVITQVVVDENDSAFSNPAKPIGPFYEQKQEGMFYDAGRGWRKIVASPKPLKIVEMQIIKMLLEKDVVVVASGGGGIPVIEGDTLKGIEGVIDKDKASQLLANGIGAEILLIITSVDGIYLNFGEENQKKLSLISKEEAKKYLEEGHFAEGSMKPKIEAGIEFLEKGGKKVIITSIENAGDWEKGTTIN
ncbi:carbamate kinase [Candidatus Micrarchaeota archaeon]|nr:carbamate kinase [Candidatus Micrarchaeota archaeon]